MNAFKWPEVSMATQKFSGAPVAEPPFSISRSATEHVGFYGAASFNTSPDKQESKNFPSKNKKGLGIACHTPPSKQAKKQGKAITQPQSHPIKEFRI